MRLLVLFLVLAPVLPSALAQPSTPNVLHYPDKTVEVLGLRTWTLGMIQDSLARYAPDDSLHTHGCAAALRYKVGFPDAAAMGFVMEDGRERTVIVVREPQDSARVQLRTAQFDTVGTRPEWRALVDLFRTKRQAFLFAANSYPLHVAGHEGALAAPGIGADSAAVRAVWQLLHEQRADAARDAAVVSLLGDPNFLNRVAAAAVLGNFPEHEMTWWALAEALREDDGIVKGVASGVLRALSRAAPRRVDWTPVTPGLRAMLDGTSPFMLRTVLEVLVDTEVPAELAPALLGRAGDELVFDFVASEEPQLHRPARALLVRLSGEDHGYDVGRWRAWAASLGPGAGRPSR